MSLLKKEILQIALSVLLSLFLIYTAVKAGTLNPTLNPAATMYTLENIYQRIIAGTAAGSHTLSPASNPDSTMHSLSDIYSAFDTYKIIRGTGTGTAAAASQIISNYYAWGANGVVIQGGATPPLVWQTGDNPANTYNFANAGAYCAALMTGGFTWHLPTAGELLKGLSDQFISNNGQSGFQELADYWSSSPPIYGYKAWEAKTESSGVPPIVSVTGSFIDQDNLRSVRCVH